MWEMKKQYLQNGRTQNLKILLQLECNEVKPEIPKYRNQKLLNVNMEEMIVQRKNVENVEMWKCENGRDDSTM